MVFFSHVQALWRWPPAVGFVKFGKVVKPAKSSDVFVRVWGIAQKEGPPAYVCYHVNQRKVTHLFVDAVRPNFFL